MSGSSERPRGWPPGSPYAAPEYEAHDDPTTGQAPVTGPPPMSQVAPSWPAQTGYQPHPTQPHAPAQPQTAPHGHPGAHSGGHPGSHQAPHPNAAAPHAYARQQQPYAPYAAPQSEPSLDAGHRPRLDSAQRDDLYPAAPVRERGSEQRNAPIVPAGSVTGRSLTLVIAIMCFLACLTAGTVYLIRQSADAWMRDIASEVTVQIRPIDKTDTEKTIRDVVAFLEAKPGVAAARPLGLSVSTELLQPWLGKGDVLKSLPVPRLIAVELDRNQPPDLKVVKDQLEAEFKNASLDDHRRWQNQIRTVTRSFAAGGLAILLLMAAATTAIIVSATKSSMASNREIVEVLHFVGATDRFIAREFEKHFLRLGIRAGLVGATFALIVFLAMPLLMEFLGGSSVTMAELNRLIGTGYLDTAGYILLGMVVVVVAALCMLTSRLGVYRILNNKA